MECAKSKGRLKSFWWSPLKALHKCLWHIHMHTCIVAYTSALSSICSNMLKPGRALLQYNTTLYDALQHNNRMQHKHNTIMPRRVDPLVTAAVVTGPKTKPIIIIGLINLWRRRKISRIGKRRKRIRSKRRRKNK